MYFEWFEICCVKVKEGIWEKENSMELSRKF